MRKLESLLGILPWRFSVQFFCFQVCSPALAEDAGDKPEMDAKMESLAACPRIRIVRTSKEVVNLRAKPDRKAQIVFVAWEPQEFAVKDIVFDGPMVEDEDFPNFRTATWYRVDFNEQEAWLSGVFADCFGGKPIVEPPAVEIVVDEPKTGRDPGTGGNGGTTPGEIIVEP